MGKKLDKSIKQKFNVKENYRNLCNVPRIWSIKHLYHIDDLINKQKYFSM